MQGCSRRVAPIARYARFFLLLFVFLFVRADVSFSAADGDLPSQAQAQRTLRGIERAQRLQTELPSGPERMLPENEDPPWWFDRLPDFNLRVPTGGANVVFWVALIVIVVLLIPTLRANMWSDSRARRLEGGGDGAEDIAPEAVATRMEQAQAEADDLARQGDFAGAMHLLLLQSLSEMRRRLRLSIAASLTSREILYRASLSPDGRAHFADIVGRVEISYFGTHRPGEVDYLACRRSYDALAEDLRRGATA